MPKVDVIIPTWNRANIIGNAVKSVLNQTVKDLEIFICDDCSSDATFEVIQSFDDQRIKWIPGERGGRPAIPRNRGLKETRGEWIAFLDSDDAWLPEKLEKQFEIAKSLNSKAICSNALRFIPGKGADGTLVDYHNRWITFNDLLDTNFVITSSVLVHNSFFKLVGGFPENPELVVLEDYALWLRIATQTDFAYLNEPLLSYNDDEKNSHRGKGSKNVWIQKKCVLSDFLRWAESSKIGGDFIAKAQKKYTYARWRLYKKELFGLKKGIRKILLQNKNLCL